MGFDDDLRRAEEHVTEARRLVQRQKGLIVRLLAAGVDTWDAHRILWLLESNLRRRREEREHGRRSGGIIMRSRADIYRQKADECERAAARVANPQVQASYRQMSRQWREMAERQQTIDEALAQRRKPVE